MPTNSEFIQMNELLRRLQRLKAKLPAEAAGTGADRSSQSSSQFESLETSFLRRISNASDMLAKARASDTQTTTSAIRARSNLRAEVDGMAESIHEMTKLVKNDRRMSARGNSRLTESEKVRRENNLASYVVMLNKLERDLRCAALPGRDRPWGPSPSNLTTNFSFQNFAASSLNVEAAKNSESIQDLSEPQRMELAAVEETTRQHDEMIVEIGAMILDIQDISRALQDTINVQGEMLDSVERHLGSTHDKLETLNARTMKLVDRRGLSWGRMLILCVCLVLILAVLGVIIKYA